MSLKIALQLYSVRDVASKDLPEVLRSVREMGYDGVEFAGLYGYCAEEVSRLCKENALVPISAHVPYAELINDPKRVLEEYKSIGCSYVAIPYLEERLRPGNDGFEEVISGARLIGTVAKELGLQLLYHNHDFEFTKIAGKYALDVLYESVPADILATELDVCWVKVGGEDPVRYLEKYTGRAPVVHLKDFYGERSENMYELIGIEGMPPKRPQGFEFRPLGKGLQSFGEIICAAKNAGAEWLVVEQDRPSMSMSSVECARESRKYLKSLGY